MTRQDQPGSVRTADGDDPGEGDLVPGGCERHDPGGAIQVRDDAHTIQMPGGSRTDADASGRRQMPWDYGPVGRSGLPPRGAEEQDRERHVPMVDGRPAADDTGDGPALAWTAPLRSAPKEVPR